MLRYQKEAACGNGLDSICVHALKSADIYGYLVNRHFEVLLIGKLRQTRILFLGWRYLEGGTTEKSQWEDL